MREVHRELSAWFEAAGMAVRTDAIGNIIGRLPGTDPRKVLLIGSHLDTVPNAGKYGGILGVVAGLAVAEELRGAALPFSIHVIGFSEEEGVRFRTPYLGSYAAAGLFDPALLELRDDKGGTLEELLRRRGLDPAEIPAAAYAPEDVVGFLELHIEQGPVLDQRRLPVGVVDAIIGQERLLLTFFGTAGHAGTTPMMMRQDAGVAAARWVAAVADYGHRVPDLRATAGKMQFFPGARNVIPGRADVSLDVRHAVDSVRHRAVGELVADAHRFAKAEGCRVEVRSRTHQDSIPMDRHLVDALMAEAKALGLNTPIVPSGAGHDAAVMAQRFPSAMLFVRSPGGISHNPAEAVVEEDVAAALEVLVRVVRKLGHG